MFKNLGALFCLLILKIWHTEEINSQMNLALYGISVLDCSKYLPTQVQQIMQECNFNISTTLLIPQRFLQDCLNDSNYNKYLAPYEFSDTLTMWSLSVGMAVSHLVNLDTVQDLQLKVDVGFKWSDPRLQWNTSTNLSEWQWPTKTYWPSSWLWMPEITVLTCELSSCSISIDSDTLVDISNDGTVKAHDSLLLASNCLLDFTYFPFDNQTCVVNMLIDFPGYDDSRIEIHILNTISTGYVASNEEWDITSVDFFSIKSMTYQLQETNPTHWILSQVPVSTHSLVLVVGFKRTASFYLDNVIAPLLVIVLISVFTILLPSDAIERSEYTLTVVLAFVFFKSSLTSMQPVSNYPPLLGTYINYSFALLAVFLVAGVLVLRLWRKDPSESTPPLLLRILFIRSIHWPMHTFKKLCCQWKCFHSNKVGGLQVEAKVTLPPASADAVTNGEFAFGHSENSSANTSWHKEGTEQQSNANSNTHIGASAAITNAQVSRHLTIPSGNFSWNSGSNSPKLHNTLRDSPAANCVHEETWHTLALYVHVLNCVAFVLANVGLFCAYMVPLFIVGLRNNATPLYYNISL